MSHVDWRHYVILDVNEEFQYGIISRWIMRAIPQPIFACVSQSCSELKFLFPYSHKPEITRVNFITNYKYFE